MCVVIVMTLILIAVLTIHVYLAPIHLEAYPNAHLEKHFVLDTKNCVKTIRDATLIFGL